MDWLDDNKHLLGTVAMCVLVIQVFKATQIHTYTRVTQIIGLIHQPSSKVVCKCLIKPDLNIYTRFTKAFTSAYFFCVCVYIIIIIIKLNNNNNGTRRQHGSFVLGKKILRGRNRNTSSSHDRSKYVEEREANSVAF